MKSTSNGTVRLGRVGLALLVTVLSPLLVFAQWPFAAATTPDAQRSALNAVRSQVDWLQNATRTASTYGAGGYGNVRQQFEGLRSAYVGLTHTLNEQQLTRGANDFAELDAGLGIIQEAFTNYEQAIAAGQSFNSALNDLCRVMRESSRVWMQELNRRCAKLRVG